MNLRSFKGGIHPQEMKSLSQDVSTRKAMPSSSMVVIPITQGGAPNQPVVAVGDVVKRGQLIAKSDAFMSAPVHASISGVVKKIEPRFVVGNIDKPCIIIESDNSEEESFFPILDPFKCSKKEAIERIKEAGIVGMGGASFPTHVKLSPPPGKKIDTVIANAAECEPYLTIDERTLLEHGDEIIDGIIIEMHILDAPTGIIALEENKADLYPILEKVIVEKTQQSEMFKDPQNTLRIELCKTKYPQGGERMIIKAVTGKEIPTGGLPADAGCLVQNVGTARAISQAFRLGKPLIDRGLTLSGEAVLTPCNVEVPIGTVIGDLIPQVIKLNPGVAKIISGGPMMGIAMQNANFPVQKNTSGVLFLTKHETSLFEEDTCIGCGACLKACSCGLSPVLIIRALKANNIELAKKCGLMDCMECGSCAYVCPAHIKLVQHFKVGKQIVRDKITEEKAKKAAKEAAQKQNETTGAK